MTTMQEFADRLARKERDMDAAWNRMMDLQRDYGIALFAEFKRQFPKRRKPSHHSKAFDAIANGKAFREPWEAKAKAMYAERTQTGEAAEIELRGMAERIEPEHGDPDTFGLYLAETVRGHSYHTQGYGANKYARGTAEHYADMARAAGCMVEVRTIGRFTSGGPWPITYETYGVFVDVSPTGWEIIRRKPLPSMRETVRLCWKRGVNPRVYYPFLPHGFEESEGLDYFGGELRKAG